MWARMHIIQYKFWFIRRILQYDVLTTNTNYIYKPIWTILITFYHVERTFLENRGCDNNS